MSRGRFSEVALLVCLSDLFVFMRTGCIGSTSEWRTCPERGRRAAPWQQDRALDQEVANGDRSSFARMFHRYDRS